MQADAAEQPQRLHLAAPVAGPSGRLNQRPGAVPRLLMIALIQVQDAARPQRPVRTAGIAGLWPGQRLWLPGA